MIEGRIVGQLEKRCEILNTLFINLMATNSRTDKELIVSSFRKMRPQLNKDLDYCFEVLAGKHKLGYTYDPYCVIGDSEIITQYNNCKVREFIEVLKSLSATDRDIEYATIITPASCRQFIANLVNRDFKLGYSNKDAMIQDYSPMLAKKYQDTFKSERMYFIQEKLDGNRCIAKYNFDTEEWEFWSRSGKRLKVTFNMDWASKDRIFDGEVMTLEHAGSRDFNRTSGAINGKYTDKSGLHYFIYDIIDPDKIYLKRKDILDKYADIELQGYMTNTHILPVLDSVVVYPNHEYNWRLDQWLDKITDKGGEGIMLRDPTALYTPGKRSDGLLKYKKVQTADLRIIGWNEGNGRFEGAVGSWQCATDDNDIIVNVAGMPDNLHFIDNPDSMLGKIIEVAYFDISVNSATGQKSLRFPRLKKIRDDKNTTSMY